MTHEFILNTKPSRIALLDVLRGLAMIAMTIFHFSWDLEFFGYAPLGMTSQFGWKLFARCIAASFLMIAGFSFILAHAYGMRWGVFRKRFAMVAGAAVLISIATYLTTPERFVFFGILHQIALGSLIAVLFVRLPAVALITLGVIVIALPQVWQHDLFLHPSLWWVGLAPFDPPSNDYVPVFPWTGFMLIGLGFGRLALQLGLTARLANLDIADRQPGRILNFLGQNSLIYYLVHQPLMMGTLFVLTQIVPPATPDRAAEFIPACVSNCVVEREKIFCERFCRCVREGLEQKGIFKEVLDGKRDVTNDLVILDTTTICTANAAEE